MRCPVVGLEVTATRAVRVHRPPDQVAMQMRARMTSLLAEALELGSELHSAQRPDLPVQLLVDWSARSWAAQLAPHRPIATPQRLRRAPGSGLEALATADKGRVFRGQTMRWNIFPCCPQSLEKPISTQNSTRFDYKCRKPRRALPEQASHLLRTLWRDFHANQVWSSACRQSVLDVGSFRSCNLSRRADLDQLQTGCR